MVAIDHEGYQVARWLNDWASLHLLSITAIEAGLRTPRSYSGRTAGDKNRAKQVGGIRIEPKQIGVIGFSAGGHLASTAGTHFNEKFYEPVDKIDGASARPTL